MRSRLTLLWAGARDSLWFVPSLMTIGAAGIALLLLYLERSGAINVGSRESIFLGGGGEAARMILSSVATGLMTVTGVAFSVTVVALQLASSQFAPRVLPNFLADRANQLVLGIFIGTFTYSLLVLRVVDSPGVGSDPFIPRLSISVAIVLALISVGAFIFFINHVARAIQISVILTRASERALEQVGRLFPENFGSADRLSRDEEEPPERHTVIRASRSGYLQAIDQEDIFAIGRSVEAIIRMEHPIGEFVLEGEPLARAWPAAAIGDRAAEKLRRAFVLGDERTFEQDYELTLIEISDVAVKALSPSINDPTTAKHCIDRLSQLLLALAKRHAPQHIRTDEGRVHLIVRDLPFERAVDSAFSQIIHFGSSNPAICERLIAQLTKLIELVPPARRDPLVALHRSLVDTPNG